MNKELRLLIEWEIFLNYFKKYLQVKTKNGFLFLNLKFRFLISKMVKLKTVISTWTVFNQ